jgi:hypothetical protein
MKIYTYHMKPGATPLEAAIAVPEGFSWGAFLFGALWALYRRLWLATVIIVGLHAVVPFAVDQLGMSPILGSAWLLLFGIYIGCNGNDWRREKLERSGYVLAGIAAGRDQEESDRRFFDAAGERQMTSGTPGGI